MTTKAQQRMLGFSTPKGPAMSEHAIQNASRNALALPGVFNTRANVGKAWTGSSCSRLPNGDMLIRDPRPFDTGLPAGFTDTFGVTAVEVTADMLGDTLGVAHFIEFKDIGKNPTPRQADFMAAMSKLGARAGVARSPAEAVAIAMGRAS